jgi:hypothetical protein
MNKKNRVCEPLNKAVLASFVGLMLSGNSVWGDVSGTVYRDLPLDGATPNTYGVKDTNELGVAGITVTVTDSNGNVVGTPATTDASGNWTVAGTSGDVRVEFSNLPTYLQSSPVNTGSNTTVQFISDGATADLGLHNPADYSEADPRMTTIEFVSGDPLGGGTTAGFDGWFLFNDSDQGGYDTSSFDVLSSIGSVGAVWGTAYQRSTQTVFTSAAIRRHSGLGSIDGTNSTTGGIYTADISGSAPYNAVPWLDVNTLAGVDTGQDPRTEEGSTLPANATDPSHDVLAFSTAGKRAIGDIDVSEDDQKLYVVNLFQKNLLVIDIASKSLLETVAIPDPGCADGDYRPWAVEEHDGELFVGVTCSAETSQQVADLAIHVMQRDAATFNSVFSITDLSYSRDELEGGYSGDWGPWRLDWYDLDNQGGWPTMDPAPVLSDIAFDIDGAMILGINDYTGLQIGAINYRADTSNNSTGTEGISAGDILKACSDGAGGWVLENAGSCGGVAGASPSNNGVGGGEFFYDGAQGSGDGRHNENHWGGLALIPGSNKIAMTAMDPSSDLRAGGGYVAGYNDRCSVTRL